MIVDHAKAKEFCGDDMAINVKTLIFELEKIENKFLEVEIALIDKQSLTPEIESIRKLDRKVLIFLKRDAHK